MEVSVVGTLKLLGRQINQEEMKEEASNKGAAVKVEEKKEKAVLKVAKDIKIGKDTRTSSETSLEKAPAVEEKEEKSVLKVAKDVKIGKGAMPDSMEIPEITEKEVKECWAIVDSPKYATIFDPERIGKMKNRAPITLHGNEERRILSQPMRPIPPQFREGVSAHLDFLRKNGKIVDVDPNIETVV